MLSASVTNPPSLSDKQTSKKSQLRVCSQCKTSKPANNQHFYFHKNDFGKLTFSSPCIECKRKKYVKKSLRA